MQKSGFKIYRRASFTVLVIIISGLLNICLFSFQAKAAPIQPLKFNFAYNHADACAAEPLPEPAQTFNYPSAPMPECCLTQNRNYNAVVNTTNNKSAPTFFGLIILPLDSSIPKNNFTYNTSQITFPPPAALALASTIIRE